MSGPLAGLRVVELAGLGPGPFAAMVLADLGADVIRIDRAALVRGGDPAAPPADVLARNRRSVGIDLKHPNGIEAALRLIENADGLIEGFRPGVCERLGLGPDVCFARNPRLVFGRMTGWGQDGPLAERAGHDINYVALSGTLSMIGRKDGAPVPPINLVGDFGGGGMLLAVGMLAAMLDAQRSGTGQVVDAAMVDGAALLASMMYGFKAMGMWDGGRGNNMLDTGAHFYDVYETKDGKYVSIGGIEPHFYAELLNRLELDPESMPPQHDATRWDESRAIFAERIAEKTRGEWDAVFEGSDACYAPVLEVDEVMAHPHNAHRAPLIEVAGVVQPAPAPRFAKTPVETPSPPSHAGQHTDEVLAEFGFSEDERAALRADQAIA